MNRLIFSCLLLSLVSSSCTHQEEHADDAPAASPVSKTTSVEEILLSPEALERAGIQLARAERRTLPSGKLIDAEVQFDPSATAHISPLVPGKITRVRVALGEQVKRGQLLGTVASSDVSAARARLDQARARLSAAESTKTRQQQLQVEGIGAQRALIEAEAQVVELRAEVEGLRQQLSVFGSGSAGELQLVAPIEGTIVALHGTLGENATPEQPVFTITDPSRVWMRGHVPEREIPHVQTGMNAIVRILALPELRMSGTVKYVAPAIDERTRTLPIQVQLEVPDPRLKSGLFGSIELIPEGKDERPLVLPLEAIVTLDGKTSVFVPGQEPGRFQPREVTLGRRAAGLVEVITGLQEGEELAIRGTFTLKSTLRSNELSEGHEH